MMPMPCGLCSPQVHRQCAHEQDVHTCCSLSIVQSELYSSILPCHESSSQTWSSTCQTALSTSYSFLSQRRYHQHGHCSCGSGFHSSFFKAPPPRRSFPPQFTYSPPSLADQKPLRKFHLRKEHMDANPENKTKHQQPNEHCLPRRLQRQKLCLTAFFLVNCLLNGGSVPVCPKPFATLDLLLSSWGRFVQALKQSSIVRLKFASGSSRLSRTAPWFSHAYKP